MEEVTASDMGVIPLGKNVPYRPGARMVKFPCEANVYAVGKANVLRWVQTEEAAKAIYGDDRASKIDDISEAFYTGYAFGADIKAASDYSAAIELYVTTSIDQVL